MDKHLKDSGYQYLVGNKCTIADIAHWGWVSAAGWAGIEINEFPNLKAWEERMWARPALQKVQWQACTVTGLRIVADEYVI